LEKFKIFFFLLDDLSRAVRITSKYIGRDWNRLYWNLPFYPTRGQEELSKDIKVVDEKYQRGDVFHVHKYLNLFISISIFI
jgi:hypothetical protein